MSNYPTEYCRDRLGSRYLDPTQVMHTIWGHKPHDYEAPTFLGFRKRTFHCPGREQSHYWEQLGVFLNAVSEVTVAERCSWCGAEKSRPLGLDA